MGSMDFYIIMNLSFIGNCFLLQCGIKNCYALEFCSHLCTTSIMVFSMELDCNICNSGQSKNNMIATMVKLEFLSRWIHIQELSLDLYDHG